MFSIALTEGINSVERGKVNDSVEGGIMLALRVRGKRLILTSGLGTREIKSTRVIRADQVSRIEGRYKITIRNSCTVVIFFFIQHHKIHGQGSGA